MTETAPEVKESAPTLGQMVRSTLIVMASSVIAKAISLVQTVLLARRFGAGREMDAYVAANAIPDLLFLLLGGLALSHAFVPVLSGLIAKGRREDAWRLTSTVINTIIVAMLVIGAAAFVAAPWLIQNIVAPGFDADLVEKSAGLMRIALVGTMLFAVSGVFMGVLYSQQHFLSPQIAAVMQDVGLLAGIALLAGPLGVTGVAIGAVLGAFLHLTVQLPALRRYGVKWSPMLDWRDPDFRRVIYLMVPRVIGLGVATLNLSVIAKNLASQLGEGAVSAFDWGWRLMQIPATIVGTALGIVVFPTLSMLASLEDVAGKRRAMSGALRVILTLTIPSTAGLILVGEPLLSLLEGGAFGAADTAAIYSALMGFSAGLIVHSLLEVAARAFYADQDALTPLWVAIGAGAVNAAAALILDDVFGVGGIALANSLEVGVHVIALLVILRRKWGGINERAVMVSAAKSVIASAIMAAAILASDAALGAVGIVGGSGFSVRAVIRLGVLVGAGALVYLGAAYLLKMEEFLTVVNMILARLRGRAEAAQ